MMQMNPMLHLVPKAERERQSVAVPEVALPEGLAGWVLTGLRKLMAGGLSGQSPEKKLMRVIETISVGPKRQLLLVSCGGERFLGGTGPESVQTIVRVRPERSVREAQLLAAEEEGR